MGSKRIGVMGAGRGGERTFFRRALEDESTSSIRGMYSDGGSEEITDRALKDFVARDESASPTKVFTRGARPESAMVCAKHPPRHRRQGLRRLAGTDSVDLYQIHRFDYQHPDGRTTARAGRYRARRQGCSYIGRFQHVAYQSKNARR